MTRPQIGPDETLDVLGNGRLVLIQPKGGYRFSIDSLLLWGFIRTEADSHWIDIGTGCGILAIALAKINDVGKVTGLEVQKGLLDLARRNARLNQVESRIAFVETDIRDVSHLKSLDPADGACVNPPYYPAGSGRLNPNSQKAIARHEIMGSMEDFIKAGSSLLKRGGTFVTILPASRLPDTFKALTDSNLHPTRMRPVHSRKTQPATLVLLEAIKEKRPSLVIDPPLVIYRSAGSYTPEVQALMAIQPLAKF